MNRRWLLGAGAALLCAPRAGAASPLALSGRAVQGGHVFGRCEPSAQVLVDGAPVGQASAGGWFFAGFDRDCGPSVQIEVRRERSGAAPRRTLAIARGAFDIQRIDGLPANQVSPQDPALLARISAEASRKAVGFASRDPSDSFRSGFTAPLDSYRQSARFGGQRVLNGEAKRPHYGADLAAPVGTPVKAPGDALVSFAETGLHYEGGLVMLDHGQGAISLYLHLSRIDVRAGQRVRRGQVIAAVGKEGRATGPHLCWRMKWQGRNLDPMLMISAAPVIA